VLRLVAERAAPARPPAAHLAFDLSAVNTLDGAATALLLELRDEVVAAGGGRGDRRRARRVRAMLDLYGSHPPDRATPPPAPIGILDEIGRETLGLLGESRGFDFIGDVALSGANAVRAPRSINWTTFAGSWSAPGPTASRSCS